MLFYKNSFIKSVRAEKNEYAYQHTINMYIIRLVDRRLGNILDRQFNILQQIVGNKQWTLIQEFKETVFYIKVSNYYSYLHKWKSLEKNCYC